MRKNKNAFMLIELIIVVLIIGILAVITAQAINGMSKKAVLAEAITALGTIRIAERAYYSENGYYALGHTFFIEPFFKSRYAESESICELDGTYFSEEAFNVGYAGIYPADDDGYVVFVYPANSRAPYAPKAAEAQKLDAGSGGSYIAMDDKGEIYSNISGLGYRKYSWAPSEW